MKNRFIIGLLLMLGSATAIVTRLDAQSEITTVAGKKVQTTKIKWKNGNIKYEGQVNESGEPHGSGTFYNKEGKKVYEGPWYLGQRETSGPNGDIGILYREDGNTIKYEGMWSNDRPDGPGICYSENGTPIETHHDNGWRPRTKTHTGAIQISTEAKWGENYISWMHGLPESSYQKRLNFLRQLPATERLVEHPWFLGNVEVNQQYRVEKKDKLEKIPELTDSHLNKLLEDERLDKLTDTESNELSDISTMYIYSPVLFKDTAEI